MFCLNRSLQHGQLHGQLWTVLIVHLLQRLRGELLLRRIAKRILLLGLGPLDNVDIPVLVLGQMVLLRKQQATIAIGAANGKAMLIAIVPSEMTWMGTLFHC